MANKHIKRRSTSLMIREMPIKTITTHHFTTTSMVIIKKTNNAQPAETEPGRNRKYEQTNHKH